MSLKKRFATQSSNSQFFPIILNLVAAVIDAFGQYFYKVGGTQLSKIPIYKNWQLFAGVILFCCVMVLFVIAFKLGGRLSVVCPVYANTFAWGLLIATTLGKEPWTWGQIEGTCLIVLGVSIIAVTSSK